MIIDGRKVLYTMKGGVIQDPSIPTDGLVCYLDTRGKTNTDKHKGTLIDLSGNGNHVTLRHFNFTEDSGYVKDLMGGAESGLRFDGVDDYLQLNLTLTDYTIIVDAMMPFVEGAGNTFLAIDRLTLFRDPTVTRQYASILKPDGTRVYPRVPHEHMGKICIKVSGETLEIKTNNQIINENIKNGLTFLRIGRGQVNFRKCLIYNRALTNEEITKLMEV